MARSLKWLTGAYVFFIFEEYSGHAVVYDTVMDEKSHIERVRVSVFDGPLLTMDAGDIEIIELGYEGIEFIDELHEEALQLNEERSVMELKQFVNILLASQAVITTPGDLVSFHLTLTTLSIETRYAVIARRVSTADGTWVIQSIVNVDN